MANVTARSSTEVSAAPEVVADAVADYASVRPEILPDQYSGYRILEGGQGAGTVAAWNLQATKKRSRDVEAVVSLRTADKVTTVTEEDRNSTMVTVYEVTPGPKGSTVTMTTSWKGAGGIGGFFEKTFAPGGLRAIQQELLDNLAARLAATAS